MQKKALNLAWFRAFGDVFYKMRFDDNFLASPDHANAQQVTNFLKDGILEVS
jgi:hypothetical protein